MKRDAAGRQGVDVAACRSRRRSSPGPSSRGRRQESQRYWVHCRFVHHILYLQALLTRTRRIMVRMSVVILCSNWPGKRGEVWAVVRMTRFTVGSPSGAVSWSRAGGDAKPGTRRHRVGPGRRWHAVGHCSSIRSGDAEVKSRAGARRAREGQRQMGRKRKTATAGAWVGLALEADGLLVLHECRARRNGFRCSTRRASASGGRRTVRPPGWRWPGRSSPGRRTRPKHRLPQRAMAGGQGVFGVYPIL